MMVGLEARSHVRVEGGESEVLWLLYSADQLRSLSVLDEIK